MAGKGNTWSQQVLALLFQAVTATNIAQNASGTPITSIYISLHTADPGPSGSQSTSEATYTGYARVGVVRTTSGWALTGQTINPVSAITFGACTGGTNTLTYMGIGTLATGTGELLYSGPISPTISVSSGVTPQLTTASSITES